MENPTNIPSPERCRPRTGLFSQFAALALAALTMFLLPRIAHADVETRIISLTGDLDFGNVAIGSSAQRLLFISNSGNSTLTVSNIAGPPQPGVLLGGFSADWSGTIAPGSRQGVVVTFAPGGSTGVPLNNTNRPVDYLGSLQVVSDATSGTNSIQASGVGIQPQFASRIISVESDLNFGQVEFNSEHGLSLIISNNGNADLTISNINLPPGFSTLAGFTNLTILPGDRMFAFIAFAPTNVMHYGGVATIDSDATSGRSEFTVSGEGVYPTGQFIGLFSPETNATFDNSGYFSANLAPNGGFSGMLRLAGARLPFSGRLSPSNTFSGSIVQGSSNLAITFQIAFGSCHGVISNDTWSANLLAYRVIRKVGPFIIVARSPFEMPPGKYQFHIAGSTNSLLAPTNDGVGTIQLTNFGTTHLSGRLGDGTAFSQDTALCHDTQLPFYALLYQHQGAVQGWINCEMIPTNLLHIIPVITNMPLTNFPPILITNTPQPSPLVAVPDDLPRGNTVPGTPSFISGTNRIRGSINWSKPAQIDTNYPDGFSFQTTINGPTE